MGFIPYSNNIIDRYFNMSRQSVDECGALGNARWEERDVVVMVEVYVVVEWSKVESKYGS